MKLYARGLKRLLDAIVAGGSIVVLAPLVFGIAAIIKATSHGPVFFVQERLGRAGRVFRAYKFRTMTDKLRVPDTEKYTGDPNEITAIGKLLRRTKLDELPQLFNVFAGDMSLVGPRPQLPVQLPDFDENAKKRLLVRPGLTGMAQVNGNVLLSWPERWYYDAYYVEKLSFILDMRIVAKTVLLLVVGEERLLNKPPLNGAAND